MRHLLAAICGSRYRCAIGWTAVAGLAGLVVGLLGFRHASILVGVLGATGVSMGFRLFDYGCSARRPVGVRVGFVVLGLGLSYLGVVLVEVMLSDQHSGPALDLSIVLGVSLVSSVLGWLSPGWDSGEDLDDDGDENGASGS